jgi:Icc-related predicted phosphoesterase
MRVLVVTDLHGAHARLTPFLRPDDVLISLGDHVNLIDYHDLSGLLADFVPRPIIAATLQSIQAGDLDGARLKMAEAAGSVPNLFAKVKEAAQQTYRELSAAIPCPAYFIYGNVDFPRALIEHLKPPHRFCEAEAVEIDGRRFGLVSGHPPGPYSFGMPGEVPKKEFAQRLHRLGAVDVLCLHSPPAIDGMTFDVEADRDEEGSPDSLYFAKYHRPRLVLFGHIHQPKVAEYVDDEVTSRPVRYLNVGCFRNTGRVLEIDPRTWETRWHAVD